MRDYEFSDEQVELRRVVRRLCGDRARSREAVTDGRIGDPDLVEGLVATGVTGIGLPESVGGSGGSVVDQMVVAHELGRAVSPAPFVSSTMTAGVLAAASGADDLVAAVAAGGTVAVALHTQDSIELGDGRLHGRAHLVSDGVGADHLIVVADEDGDPVCAVIALSAAGVHVVDHPTLDRSRPLASVDLDGVEGRILELTDVSSVLDRARQVSWLGLAAESAGVAERALEMTASYALQRSQFGEVIGRFQAVKHRLADDLVLVENARSASRWAAWALLEDDPSADTVVAAAKAVSTENAVDVVADAIQLHGGIAITWEHDLHLLLRRARTNAKLGGSPTHHRERVVRAQLRARERGVSTTATAADLSTLGDEAAAMQRELDDWLDANLPDGWPNRRSLPAGRERITWMRDWQRRMAEGRWVNIHWAVEHGGRGASLEEQVAYHATLAARAAPGLIGHTGVSVCAPTILTHGTEAQRERFLGPMFRGEELWCEGFSEPGAGSDLAGLQCRGVVDGDELVITGQKTWTSGAAIADWMFALVRTDPAAPKRDGISFVLIPMSAEGLESRPIRQISGDAEFSEVFLDEVRVPLDNVVGEFNRGWYVARTTLAHERSTLFLAGQLRMAGQLDELVDLFARVVDPFTGEPMADDAHLRQRVARAWIDAQLSGVHGARSFAKAAEGSEPGPESAIMKLFGQESQKRFFELAADLSGVTGLLDRGSPDAPDRGKWLLGYLRTRASTIGGGTSEIQRNILSERVLGMPRDPWND